MRILMFVVSSAMLICSFQSAFAYQCRTTQAELKTVSDGKIRVCVDACAVENDLQVYKIVWPR